MKRVLNLSVNKILERCQRELTPASVDGEFTRAAHRLLMQCSVLNQICNGANAQVVVLSEDFQFRTARHGAVLVHDLDNDGRRLAARHARKIDTGFGVSSALEDATRLRYQRKNVPRLRYV